MRESVAAMLGQVPSVEVVGQTASIEAGLDLLGATNPDVVLVDLWLGMATRREPDGVALIREARSRGSRARFVAFTGDTTSELLSMVLAAGGNGYVSKTASAAEVLRAIDEVMEGRVPVIATFTEATESSPPVPTTDDPLSPRELEVLQLIAKGLSSKEAAEQLQISPTTVDTYRRRIATKLGSRSRAALVRYALAHGMLD
ncbi:MAG: response regulator transcription factor [Sandaracinus sp.]|nr:response regulator transcription factor [Sandaracinus sp.]